MTDVSIVIASYNTCDLLLSCLESIAASKDCGEVEVFVVDNDSSDGTVEALGEHFPDVKLVLNRKNLGFAAANNRALTLAAGRYLLLLNPDTRLDPSTIGEVTKVMDERPEVGMTGIKLVRQDGSIDKACRRGFPTPLNSAARFLHLDRLFPQSKTLGGYNLGWKNPDGEYEVDSVVGAFMFLRREVIEDIGLLDESYFMYGEDIDWCWRIKDTEWKVLYLGSQEALHVKGASTSQTPLAMNSHFHRAMFIFHKKHLENRYPFFINWIVQAGIGLRWGWRSLALRLGGASDRS